jgi:hypothetical protein
MAVCSAFAVVLPVFVLMLSPGLEALAGLYAIGVVGAIAVNLGSCGFNLSLPMSLPSRIMMCATFLLLCGVELTLAHTKPDALFFVTCVLLIGLGLRAWSQKHKGVATVTVPSKVAEMVERLHAEETKPALQEGGKILVCLRGVTPVLRYAIETAKMRSASLYVLYVREVAVAFGASAAGLAASVLPADAPAFAGSLLAASVPVLPGFAVSVLETLVSAPVPVAVVSTVAAALFAAVSPAGSAARAPVKIAAPIPILRTAVILAHLGHLRSASALIDWNSSQAWPHFEHSYS